MDFKEVMTKLESLGTAQTRKVYMRHIVGPDGEEGMAKDANLFGVSFSDLGKLTKKLKGQTDLALKLWDTKNIDAQTLAAMIVDPKEINERQFDKWLDDLDYFMTTFYVAGVLAASDFARKKIETLVEDEREYYRACGYGALSRVLKNEDSGDTFGVKPVSDQEAKKYLEKIEREIHTSANRAKYSMNNCLIAIAVYKSKLTDLAIETAKRIGKVQVKHATKGCTTPDAVSYIKKSLAKRAKKK
jgi:3-methyladenine DNA glycosylase AlkD